MSTETPGGQGEPPPRRSDIELARQALRNDWPLPAKVKAQLLQQLVNYCDDDNKFSPRVVISAARAIAAFCRLSLGQQALDLAREKHEGKSADVGLSELVDEAEKRAEARINERA